MAFLERDQAFFQDGPELRPERAVARMALVFHVLEGGQDTADEMLLDGLHLPVFLEDLP